MHYSTSSNLSRASVMFVTSFAFFSSVCIGVPAAGSSASLSQRSCAAGRHYMVRPKDTCTTISQAQSVSTLDIMDLNCLKPDGTDLRANATIKLPGCCSTYNVKQGDNCTSIASTHNLTLPKFLEFNPLIHHSGSNLESGYNVCLTAPQGTSSKHCTAKTATSDTAKASLAPGTSAHCTQFHVAVSGDDCLSLALGGNVSLFRSLNPSINSDCTNLTPGLKYCVSTS